jgi:hypothetical protein
VTRGSSPAFQNSSKPAAIGCEIESSALTKRLRLIDETRTMMEMFERQTYKWYRMSHPESVHGARVSCHKCGSLRTQARSVTRQTYHREHFCTQCGTTLYYSPELQGS